MTTLRTALVLLAGAGLLAACGPKGGQNAVASGQAAAPSSVPDVEVTADLVPVPKAGLWETTTSMNGGPPHVARHCADGKPLDAGKMSAGCSAFTMKKTFLGAYVIDATCSNGQATSVTHTTMQDITSDGYTTDGVVTLTMPGRAPLKNANHTVAKYIGPCPAGGAGGGG